MQCTLWSSNRRYPQHFKLLWFSSIFAYKKAWRCTCVSQYDCHFLAKKDFVLAFYQWYFCCDDIGESSPYHYLLLFDLSWQHPTCFPNKTGWLVLLQCMQVSSTQVCTRSLQRKLVEKAESIKYLPPSANCWASPLPWILSSNWSSWGLKVSQCFPGSTIAESNKCKVMSTEGCLFLHSLKSEALQNHFKNQSRLCPEYQHLAFFCVIKVKKQYIQCDLNLLVSEY